MTSRRRRTLTGPEIELWHIVTRHVEPLSGRRRTEAPPADGVPGAAPAAPSPSASPPAAAAPPGRPPASSAKPPAAARPPSPPALPPLAPLERKLKRGLDRGTHPVHAVLDLHCMRQDEAHMRLRAFIARSREQGATVVLVVTGKGARASEGAGAGDERGVLRRTVPHWLRMPDLRAMVVGFEEAAPHQGGAGALYVRLRRRRGPEERA